MLKASWNDNCELQIPQVLLVLKATIDSLENIGFRSLCSPHKLAVLKARQPGVPCGLAFMFLEVMA